jgi:ABC-2 type transport system permease protein
MTTALATGRPTALGALVTEILAVTGRRLRHLRRAPARVLGVALSPLVSMLMLGYLFRNTVVLPDGGDYGEYVFAGGAVQVALACTGPTAISVAVDLKGGMTDRFRSLPIGRSAVLFGHTLADLLVGLLGLALVTPVGLLLGWRPHTGVLPVLGGFALIAVFIYAMVWVGVMFALTLRSVETISVITPFVVIVLPFLSNAFLSPGDIPPLVRPVAQWNPVSAMIASCRQLWGNPAVAGGGYPAQHPELAAAVSLVVLLAVSSLVSLRRYRTAGD